MKDGAVMPDLVGLWEIDGEDIVFDEGEVFGSWAETAPGAFKGCTSKVEDGEIFKAGVEEVIYEARGATADVDDGRIGGELGAVDEVERVGRLFLEPAEVVFGAIGVDLFPIIFEHVDVRGCGLYLTAIRAKVNKGDDSAKGKD